jgi:hypothetical protein
VREEQMSVRTVCLEGNKWVTLTSIGAAIVGLYNTNPKLTQDYIPEYLFFVFLVAFRVKLYLDDQIFFLSIADFESKNFKIGMIFALASWILIVLSALSTSKLGNNNSYLFLLLSVMVSTLWIVSEAFRVGAYHEQYYWIATNALYMGLLAFLIWLHPEASPIYDWIALSLLILIVAVDFFLSDPLPKLHALEAKTSRS